MTPTTQTILKPSRGPGHRTVSFLPPQDVEQPEYEIKGTNFSFRYRSIKRTSQLSIKQKSN